MNILFKKGCGLKFVSLMGPVDIIKLAIKLLEAMRGDRK